MAKTLQDKLIDIQNEAGTKVEVEIRLSRYAMGAAWECYWIVPPAEVNLKWVHITEKEFNELCRFFKNETMYLNRMETEAKPLPHIQTVIRNSKITMVLTRILSLKGSNR